MSLKIWVRPLNTDETKHIIEKQFDSRNVFISPASIMGPEDHIYVRSLNVEVKLHRVHLGNSQYIDEATWRDADPKLGRRVPVMWGLETAYSYLMNEAEKVGIQILRKPHDFNILYLPTKYERVIAEGFSYVDKTLHRLYEEQSFFGKWFGGSIVPEYNSPEAKEIRNQLQKILLS